MQSSAQAPDEREGRDRAILLVAEDEGIAARRIEAVLGAHGHTVTRAAPDDPDLFSRALGQRAIVFVPSRNLLSAVLEGGGTERVAVDAVLSATRAPGVELLVAALPEAPRFDELVDAVERHGKPYAIVRAPGLMEEVAQTLEQGERTLWLPRTGTVRISRADALAEAVAAALDSEDQGRVTPVCSESFDVASLFDAAARSSGGKVRVRAVTPVVYRLLRPVARWLKGGEPPPLAFADRLLATGESRQGGERAGELASALAG
jgi:hypothetical protein